VIFHVEDYETGAAEFSSRLGIAAAVALIALIGGRVIPSFTRNWLARENPGRLPLPFGRFDQVVLIVSVLAMVSWVANPGWIGTAALMLFAAAAQALRMARWAGHRTWRDRLVLILHIGYAFVPLGFAMLAAHVLMPQVISISVGIHAWTTGAVGTMTLAIMTRASLGHTGQVLAAVDARHLRRHPNGGGTSDRRSGDNRRNDCAAICSRRCLGCGILDVCSRLWSPADAAAENRTVMTYRSSVRHQRRWKGKVNVATVAATH
jgi:hypothetical protein